MSLRLAVVNISVFAVSQYSGIDRKPCNRFNTFMELENKRPIWRRKKKKKKNSISCMRLLILALALSIKCSVNPPGH